MDGGVQDRVDIYTGTFGKALGGASGELQNLSVAALLTKVMQDGNDGQKAALRTLLDGFRK